MATRVPTAEDPFEDRLLRLDQITKPVRDQRLIEARITFALACVLIMLGAGLILLEALRSPMQLGIARTALAALITLGGGTILKLHKSAHDQLVKDQRDREIRAMIGLITNKNQRNQAIQEYLAAQKTKDFWKRLTDG